MKIRNGFVSNSSSSSFVVIGYKASELISDNINKEYFIKKYSKNADWLLEKAKQYGIDEVWYELLYETNFGVDGVGYLSDDGPGYIGVILANIRSDDSYLENSEMELENALAKCSKLQEIFGVKKSAKIYIGTRSC